MGNRCPSCEKFAPLDTANPELDKSEVELSDNGDGSVSVACDVRVVRMSQCCYEEMKEATFEFDETVDHACSAKDREEGRDGDERYEVIGVQATASERQQTHDRRGKPIRRARYAKTYIGAEVSIDVKCTWCGETLTASTTLEEQASAFEELV